MEEITKYCPYRVYSETVPAILKGDGDKIVQNFYPCIKHECMAYNDGVCVRGPMDDETTNYKMNSKKSNNKVVIQVLHEIGVSSKYKGTTYICEAIYIVAKSDIPLKITKDVYPVIAEKYKSSPTKVERAIRTAIIEGWLRGDPELQHKVFGYACDKNKGNPTNSEFIYAVAEYINYNNIQI